MTQATASREQLIALLREANAVALAAVADGHHPFGALLVAPDWHTVVMRQGNLGTVAHAESTLCQRAFEALGPDALWDHALVTTVEPCVMCAGTQYWANIGTLVYGMSERQLLSFTGSHAENPTLDVPCRYVFEHGQKPVRVLGPFPEVAEEIAAPHRDFW